MANLALKCRILILNIARSFCSYNNILINFGQLYSNSCYTIFQCCNFGHVYSMWISWTLGSMALYLSHISAPHKMSCFLLNWPCRYGSPISVGEKISVEMVSMLHTRFLVKRELMWVQDHESYTSWRLPTNTFNIEYRTKVKKKIKLVV